MSIKLTEKEFKKLTSNRLSDLIHVRNKSIPISTKALTQETLRALSQKGFFAFPVKNTGTYSEKAKAFIRGKNFKGISDIIAVSPDGLFWGIEIKNKSTKDRQSNEQEFFEKEVKARKAVYKIVKTFEDIKKLFEA